MSDIIERAEAAIERALHKGNPAILLRELVTALKAARAENERLRSTWMPPEDDEEPLNYTGLDRSCDSYYGMGESW